MHRRFHTDAVERFYRTWVRVDDVAHLAGEGIGLLAKVLLGDEHGRRSVA